MSKEYIVPSVKKAFDILRTIASSREGIGLNEIARTLDIAKSTTHGITLTLEKEGAIRRDPSTRKYQLGLTLFGLGWQAYSKIDLRKIARPVMEELMEKIQESVFLGTMNRNHDSILVLDVVECEHDLKITSPIGTILSIFAAAPGKAILSAMDEKKVMEIITTKGLPRRTDRSITDPEIFYEEIRNARRNGYASDYEEYLSGVRAVAAPITGEKDRLATIYTVGFKARLDDNKMDLLKREIRGAAKAIDCKIKDQTTVRIGRQLKNA